VTAGLEGHVALFGGTFNPPHLGHLALAEAARDEADLGRVLWMPAATPPHKQDARLSSGAHRLAMTRLAVAGNDAFAVSDLELLRAGVSYTIDTLRTLGEAHPDARFVLLIGGDSLVHFASWREPEEILRRADLLVYPRPGSDLTEVDQAVMRRATLLDRPLLDISSTTIRTLLHAGRSARYLVPDAVLAYAAEHGVYTQ
jgi:nicotinate-nucleotide adenylyltransferase